MKDSEAEYIKKLEKELKDLREQSTSQLSMYEMTAIYLKKLQEDLKKSETKLLEANRNLTDSIEYAKHIQDAFIVQIGVLQKLFPESFIFQKPKDIVSGDFVWAYQNDDKTYLAVGDCSGHGVPGAMLSIFVISMLNQIVNHFDDESPADILEKLDKLMQKYLSQYSEQLIDSAEISIIKYDTKNQKLYYSGAKRPLIHVRNKIISTYDGAKYVLGNVDRMHELVKNIEVDIQKNDMLYMLSDGFADQFGGDKNHKFSTKKLLTLLQDISELPINQQFFG
jgi:phosphoserine phosphatase RsbU/P